MVTVDWLFHLFFYHFCGIGAGGFILTCRSLCAKVKAFLEEVFLHNSLLSNLLSWHGLNGSRWELLGLVYCLGFISESLEII